MSNPTPLQDVTVVDEYGFTVPKDLATIHTYNLFNKNYTLVLNKRLAKWKILLHVNGPEGLKKGEKLKRFVRKGIPKKYRAEIWMSISGASNMKKNDPELYKRLGSIQTDTDSVTYKEIMVDIPRTFPTNLLFSQDLPDGLRPKLINVLVAYSNHNQKIKYRQGMNYVAAMLLLVTNDEERAFWLLKVLLEEILPDYYSSTLPGLLQDIDVLSELIKKKCPLVYKHVVDHGMPWDMPFSRWIMCLYSNVLPVETVLRIWDCLFESRNTKVLFRIAIVLVLQRQKEILAANETHELSEEFKRCALNEANLECHVLMRKSFEKVKNFSIKDIEKLRQDYNLKKSEADLNTGSSTTNCEKDSNEVTKVNDNLEAHGSYRTE